MHCNAINHKTGAHCARPSGHEGHHEGFSIAHGASVWPTRREREGKAEPRDTSLDLACVEREDVDGEERWWIRPTPERVADGAKKNLPMVMFAFHSRDSAETVCITLNAMALGDAMHAVADDDPVAA